MNKQSNAMHDPEYMSPSILEKRMQELKKEITRLYEEHATISTKIDQYRQHLNTQGLYELLPKESRLRQDVLDVIRSEKARIILALTFVSNSREAIKLLGISERTFYRKTQKYNIDVKHLLKTDIYEKNN